MTVPDDIAALRRSITLMEAKMASDEEKIASLETRVQASEDLVKRGKIVFTTIAGLGAIAAGVLAFVAGIQSLFRAGP